MEYPIGDMSREQAEYELNCLLEKFKDLFVSGPLEKFTDNKKWKFSIATDGEPINEVSSLSVDEKEELMWKVDELLNSDYLEYSKSPWSSPVKLKDINGKLEICVDYKNLNAITEDHKNVVMPTISDVLYSISQSNVFSKVVLKDAYHQLMLDEDSKDKTAFEVEGESHKFQFKTFHLGLKNAPQALQWTMNDLLKKFDPDRIKVYGGQILVHTNGYYDHLEMLRDLFNELLEFNLKVASEESQFLREQLVYLGKSISEFGIGISDDQLDKINSFLTPRNKTEVRSFLGLITHYKDYVDNLAFDFFVRPLRDLTRQDRDFKWDKDERVAFKKLKLLMNNFQPISLLQPTTVY